ncbi:DUF2834 domain-containing protein [Pseudomonas sp. 5P_3.1_Bac2]|uniref:DUF2834 domain-containing protein n=1 Tax=Pseudomonas sp. 5P_3.1_Bac2 TaxID=2971617 RepID=UPI0021CA600A|nr:DUF2834 domain-containing protein [Pseudomonas sp. 5P_3.1_Bac2]MCU1717800.1 DUF2834 domain-containing protein [Pseudomonas sp. 5P_3.1_Bac2]
MLKLLLPLFCFISFGAYTLWVMVHAEQSLMQFGLQLLSHADTAQVVIDLYLLASMACVWIYHDGRKRGKSLLYLSGFFILTALFVSLGPLLYCVLRALPNKPATQLKGDDV